MRVAYGNVIDPNQVGLIDGDSITTPDVLRVDVRDSDVPVISQLVCTLAKFSCLNLNALDDDVLNTADHTQTTALDNTAGTLANQGLVGANGDTQHTSVVADRRVSIGRKSIRDRVMRHLLGDSSGSGIRFIVGAPVILVDGNLAGGASTPRSTTGGSGSTLSISEVETNHHCQQSATHCRVSLLTSCSER